MKFPESVIELAHKLERRVGWYRMPLPLGVAVIALMRDRLRQRNFFDTGQPTDLALPESNGAGEPAYLTARTADGTFNDLGTPPWAAPGPVSRATSRSNTPSRRRSRELSTPNPRLVSRGAADPRAVHPGDDPQRPGRGLDPVRGPRLVQPRPERPRTSRGRSRSTRTTPGPSGRCRSGGRRPTRPADPRRIAAHVRHRRHPLVGRLAGLREHAGSQRPRSGTARAASSGVDPDGLLRPTSTRTRHSDVPGQLWVGLGHAPHPLRLEHNAICDRLRADYPSWSDDQLFDKARLINAALHGQDPHRRVDAGDHRATRRRSSACGSTGGGSPASGSPSASAGSADSEVISGIPGSPTTTTARPTR